MACTTHHGNWKGDSFIISLSWGVKPDGFKLAFGNDRCLSEVCQVFWACSSVLLVRWVAPFLVWVALQHFGSGSSQISVESVESWSSPNKKERCFYLNHSIFMQGGEGILPTQRIQTKAKWYILKSCWCLFFWDTCQKKRIFWDISCMIIFFLWGDKKWIQLGSFFGSWGMLKKGFGATLNNQGISHSEKRTDDHFGWRNMYVYIYICIYIYMVAPPIYIYIYVYS